MRDSKGMLELPQTSRTSCPSTASSTGRWTGFCTRLQTGSLMDTSAVLTSTTPKTGRSSGIWLLWLDWALNDLVGNLKVNQKYTYTINSRYYICITCIIAMSFFQHSSYLVQIPS